MVTSATYRESSAGRPDLRDIDPYNRLLARQARFRLDAGFVRDTAPPLGGVPPPPRGRGAAMPARSRAMSTASPSTNRKQQLKLLASRRSGSKGPVMWVKGTRAGTSASRRSRRAR